MNIKLKCPHDWRDIERNKAWSKDVRENSERIGLKVKHSEYGESFFYTKDGELRGCGYHRFMNCGFLEVTLEELKAMNND